MSMDERGVGVALPAPQARGGLGPRVGSVSPHLDAAPQNPASGNFVAAALRSPDSQNVRNTDSSDTEVSRNLADGNVLTPSSCPSSSPVPPWGREWVRQPGSLTRTHGWLAAARMQEATTVLSTIAFCPAGVWVYGVPAA